MKAEVRTGNSISNVAAEFDPAAMVSHASPQRHQHSVDERVVALALATATLLP